MPWPKSCKPSSRTSSHPTSTHAGSGLCRNCPRRLPGRSSATNYEQSHNSLSHPAGGPMSAAQAILIMGGMFNLMFSTIAAFLLYWVRLRDPAMPVPHYGLITHTSSVTNGTLLLTLALAIQSTSFAPGINRGLAVVDVIATFITHASS